MSLAELRAFERGQVAPEAHARRREVQAWLGTLDTRLDPMTIGAAQRAREEMPQFDRCSAARRAALRNRP